MKFVAVFEWDAKDDEKVWSNLRKMAGEREKYPDKFPKIVAGGWKLAGQNKGFQIYETDDPQQFENLAEHHRPFLKIKFLPLYDEPIVQHPAYKK